MEDQPEEVTDSMIGKVVRGLPWEKVITYTIVAVIGVGGGAASHRVSDARETAVVQDNRNLIIALEAKVKALEDWKDAHRERERKYKIDMRTKQFYYERRFSILETRLRLSAPPEPSAPSADAAEEAPPN